MNCIEKPSEVISVDRDKLNTLLRLAKKNYFSSQLDREKNNMKNKAWTILNSIPRFVTHF